MIQVEILRDESSHWFIVPITEVDEFRSLSERIMENEEDYEAINEFVDKFSKHMTGGGPNNYQLFISEDELKNLTGDV